MVLSFGRSKKIKISIEIDKNYLKIAQSEISNKPLIISKLITKPISGFSDTEISGIIADVINVNNIKFSEVIAVISRERIMLRYLRLPAVTASEIEQMVSFELTKQTPYSSEEIVSDYKIINIDEQGYSDLMLVVAHKNEIARILSILNAAGIHPEKIRLSSEAISTGIDLMVREKFQGKELCLVDIDNNDTEIAIVSGGKLRFSRVANIGSARLSIQEESDIWESRLVEEIRHSVSVYKRENDIKSFKLSEYIVTGASLVVDDFSALLHRTQNIDSRPLNVLSSITLAGDALPEEGIASTASLFAVCASLFLPEDGALNLIPHKQKLKQIKQKKLRIFFAITAVLASVILALLAVGALQYYHKNRMLSQMKIMLMRLEPTAKSTEAKLKKLEVIRQQLSEEASSLDAIYQLYKLIPQDISLIDFDYDDASRVVSFRGKAERMSDVFKLATILEDSDRFSNVQTRSVTKRSTKESDSVDFRMRCNFIPQGAE